MRANIEAIRTLKRLEEEAREATAEEKAVLVKYTGWGAFAQDMFLNHKDTFKNERDEFRALVTDEEYEAARTSTLNAHYTSADVISGMWDAIQQFGYTGGLAMEPSSGVGHFIGLIPDAIAARTAWTAVELDPLTAGIAAKLYAGAEVNNQGFETLKRPSNYYDLVISNVPFGDYKISEKPYGSHSIHDFFFVKSLDKVRPGGVVAFVTSRYTMDRQDSSVRALLAKNADLVGAIRLPGGNKGAFAGNAGTQVTTDIIFLRKRAPGEAPFSDINWMETAEIQTPEGPARINQYFADRPEMMLGEMRLQGSMYRANEPVLVGESDGLRQKIAEAAIRMPAGAFGVRELRPPPVMAETAQGKDGAFFEKDGAIYRNTAGVGIAQKLNPEATQRVKKLIGLRDTVNALLAAQIARDDAAAKSLRGDLKKAYDAFVKKYGPINKEVTTVTKRLNKAGEPVVITRHPNLADFDGDPDAPKVAALEVYDAESGKATRAAIQERTVIAPPADRKINGPGDALAAVLDAKGRVDLNEIGIHLGVNTEGEVIARLGDLIYRNPNGREWETADQYLSGDVVRKLEEARSIAKADRSFARNVEALEKVQPPPLTATDIEVQFGAPWVPTEIYETFLKDIGIYGPKVRRMPITGAYKIEKRSVSSDLDAKYGTDRVAGLDVVEAAINNSKIVVRDRIDSETTVVNHEATQQAQIKVDAVRETFSGDREAGIDGWVFQDRDRTELLEGIYNRTFNNLAPRKFDGAHQTFPGMSADLTLRPHQKDAVWRTVQNGNTLFAHVVGAGKTYTMIASGMEQKRLGLITKPAYVVPNHMLEQFSREFIQAYPNARILVASKDEMSRDSRAAFVAKAATNDWDAIVITHDAFGRIPVGPDVQESFIREQIAELERIIEGEAAEGGKKSPTVKELEKAKLKLEERLKKLLNAERKDIGTTFEESGIDHLFVDEAHLFKNLSFATRLQRVKGLAQGNSQRAEDLYMKIRYLEQKRPSRSAVFATGTPVSNTMAELWTMMRYLELDKLRERGLDLFDSWANTFGKIRTTMELGADARSLKEVTSFSKFVNVPELISIYSEIADTRTADMLKLPRPDVLRPDGKAGIEIVKAEPSEEEEAHILSLVKLAESLKGQKPEKGKPNMLSVVTAGRKVATDGRLIGPDFAFNPKGKIALAVDRIHDIYAKGKEPALAQMVFLDLGVPGGKSAAARKPQAEVITAEDDADPSQSEPTRFNLYADLKERLVTKGIPANEIAFIHDADTDEKKAKLFKLVRSGAVRVLVGSSSKMGVGTNVQDRLIAMHHLDAPWKPAEVEQRDGRIVRQGNLNPNVQIYRYITERSFDAFMWQKLDTKSQFIAQVLSGTKGSRHAEDVDSPLPEAAEMKAAASGDPRIMQHADLTRQVRQLQAQKRSFDATAARSQHEIKSLRSQIGLYESAMPDVQADAAKVEDLAGDKFKVDVDGQTLTERKAAGEKILSALIKKGDTWRPVEVVVGKMSGFDMVAEIQQKYESGSTYLSATLKLSGAREYASTSQFVINSKTDPGGLVRRFENILSAIRAEPTRYEERLTTSRATLQKLEATSDAKWPRANELAERSAQLAALTKDMAAKDKPDAEAITTPEDSGQTFNQTVKQAPDGGAVRGNITFTQSPAGEQRSLMRLFRDRNLSTVLHETGHLWLEELRADAAQAYAPQQLKDDWQKVRDWLGVPEGEDITIEQHEKWARGVEAYLMEGKSPSVTLSGVFARFKAWLVSIYKTALWLRVDLNDDMRGVMDRLIATDEAIAEAKTEIGARRLFASADQAGMTEAEFKAYTDSVTRTQDRAEQAVLDKLMSQVRARRTAEWKEEASALRAEVSGMVDSEPAMRAFNYLRGAALPESLAHLEGMPRMRIAREDLAEYGNPVLPKSVPPIDTDKNGSPVADIAEVLGFADGRAMIDALAGFAREQTALKEAGDKRSVRVSRIDAEVERIMAERHGDMLNDGSIEAEALSALHNEARSDVLAAEVRALARQTGKPATPFQMARQWAKRAIAEKAIPEVMDLSAYTRAEAKAARLAEQAMIKGDADEALRRKQEQMIAHALWMEARDAKEEIEAGRKRMDRLAGVRTIKSMDQDYLEKIHALLERFGIKSPSPRAVTESLRAWADTQIAAGIDIAIPENFLDEAWRKNYDKLTVEEFRGLSDSVKQLAHLGRLAKKIEIDGEKREFEETIAEALTTVAATPQRGVSGDDTGLTPLQEKLGRVVSGLRSADASLLKMETLLEWLDGDKTGRGIFSRTVFKRIAAAQGRESDRLKGLTDQLAAIYAKVPQNQRDRWLDVHSLPGLPKPDGTSKWNKTSIISMALNIGNEGNLDKLLRGYKWDEQTLRDTLNQRLTREEWRFVQDIWDLIETQWPDLAAVHRRVNGVEPPKVERIPVPTPFGTLPGGYYKAAYDRNLSIPAEKIGEKQDTAVAVGQIFPSGMTRPSTRAGATHERTGFAAPIRLSLDLIDQQLKDAAHDIEFREAVLDAHKFLNDDRIRQAIREAVGPEYERQFAPWLHNIAHEWQSDRDGLSFVNQFANVARTNVTIVALGFRISTALAQTAGFANSVQRLGVVHMAEGLKTFSLSPVQQTAFVREKSAEMRNRANSLERDMRAAQLKMQGRSGALNDIRRLSFEGIAFMDAAVSIPTWLGAYSRGLKEGMTDDEAIYYGDKMVRDTQGAGAAKDMAAIQRGGPILKLFTMFYSYFNVLYNRQRGIVRDAQEGHWGSAINQSFFLLIAAPLLGAFLTGQGPEEEEEWTTWAVRNTAFGMFAGLPWVRDLSFAASTAVGGKYYGGAKLSPVETFGNNLLHMAKDGVKLASGEEASTGALKNTFNVAGVLTGLPLGQVGQTSQFVWDVMIAGSQQPETLGDWLKGLVFGPERK